MNKDVLGKYVKVEGGYAFKSANFVNNGIPVIRISNLTNQKLNLKDCVKYPDEKFDEFKKYQVKEGDLLIAMSGATTGKIGIVNELEGKCLLNQRVGNFKIRDSTKLNKKFLYFIVTSKNYQKKVKKIAAGCAQPNISSKKLEEIEVNIPPLKTQQRIVEILEKAEKLKEWRAEADVLTNEYLKSVFLEMFGDPIQNSKSFQTSLLKDLCTFKSGGTPSRKHEEFFEGNIPWITTVALGPRYIDSKDAAEYITTDAISKSATKLIPKDSVLIGTRVGVGKTSINKSEICTNQDITSLVDINEKLNNEFLLYLLSFYEGFFESQLRGATIKGITSSTLKNLNIILPPIQLQNQFAETVKKVEQIKQHQKQSKQQIDTLFNTLMQKAFKGELTC